MVRQAEYVESVAFCNFSCSLAPLTTVYTPPASCADNWTPVYSYSIDGGQNVLLTRNFTATDCMPTQWTPGCDDCAEFEDISNISPGVCPDGATAASTGIRAGVTTHYCCPFTSAAFLERDSSSRCYHTFSGLRTLSYNATIYTSSSSAISASDTTSTDSPSWTSWNTTYVTATVTTVFFKSGTLEAKAFVVRFKEADFQTSSGEAYAATSTAAAATAETSTKDAGLTIGARTGVGIGAAIGALLLIAVGMAIFWLRKKKRDEKDDEKDTGRPEGKVEVDGNQALVEMPTTYSTAELHAQPMPPIELQASRYREVNPDEPAELGDGLMSGR